MQRFWKVVQGKGVVTKVQGAVIRQKLRHPRKSLRRIAADLAKYGVTNGGGRPYHPYQVRDFVKEGASRLRAFVHGEALEHSRKYVAGLVREKVPYYRSTESDPYLHGRLEWWSRKLRRVGKKPNSSWYDKEDRQ